MKDTAALVSSLAPPLCLQTRYISLEREIPIIRGGQAQLFFESAIAIPQLEGSTSAIAIPQLFKEMLLRNRNSAIPQMQFFLKSAT